MDQQRMIRVRVPSDVYDALQEEAREASMPLATHLRNMIVARHIKRHARDSA